MLEFPDYAAAERFYDSADYKPVLEMRLQGRQVEGHHRRWPRWLIGAELAAYRAVGTLYNALMTALVLGLVTRRGEDTAREYVFRHFRRQHLEKFLPGLQKLGLAGRARCAGLRALSLSLQRAGRREDRLPARKRPQGLGALSAAALDLARHGDRRRAACGVGGDAARLARPQRRVARQRRAWASSAPA